MTMSSNDSNSPMDAEAAKKPDAAPETASAASEEQQNQPQNQPLTMGFAASATVPVPQNADKSALLAGLSQVPSSAAAADDAQDGSPHVSVGFAASAAERVPAAILSPEAAGSASADAASADAAGTNSADANAHSPPGNFWERTKAAFQSDGFLPAEKYLVGLILLLMGLLPTAEAICRLVLGKGIPGALTYTQHLTLWVGFLGALLATGSGKHLGLAIGEFLHGPVKKAADLYAGVVSAVVCTILTYAAVVMVGSDAEMHKILPGGIPEWLSESIMPAALLLMSLRFVWKSSEKPLGRLLPGVFLAAAFVLGLLRLHANGALTLPFISAETRDFAVFEALESHAESLIVPGTVILLLGVLLGAPLFICMAGLAMLFFFGESTPVASVPSETYRLVQNASLPAIPILTAAGYVLAEGGASRRLLRVAKALVGWLPGGLALMVVAVLAGFTTFTGGSGVTILALGGLVLPMLIKENYPKEMSIGLVTSSGSLGLLFPPSLPVILYSVVAGVGMNELFIAGLLPGMLLVVLVAGVGMAMGIKSKAPRQPFSIREALSALWEAKWELFIPLVVLVAIFTGIATLVEAAAIAFLAAIIAECIVFKDLSLKKDLPDSLGRAGALVGAVIILMGVAMGLTSYITDAEIPAQAIDWAKSHIDSQWAFLLALNGVLLVLGSVLEIYSAIVILAPLLVPMAGAYGIDPIHLGIVFLANMELGFLFPPIGLNLILSSTRFNEPLTRLYKVALPFLLIMALGVLLTTYIPAMTTGFLAFVKG